MYFFIKKPLIGFWGIQKRLEAIRFYLNDGGKAAFRGKRKGLEL